MPATDAQITQAAGAVPEASRPADQEQAHVPDAQVAAVREFNRFYTNVLGLLREGLLDTPYSLTEARIIFELARQDRAEVTRLRHWLDIDPGYLSRILARFEADGLVTRARSPEDARRQARRTLGPADPGPARRAYRGRPQEPYRSNDHHPRTHRGQGPASCGGAPAAGTRRTGLGRAAPWRALRRRVWLGRNLRGARGPDRRGIRRPWRPLA